MMKFLTTVFVFLGASLVFAGTDDAAKEQKAFAGQWQLVAIEVNGEIVPKEKLRGAISFTLRADGSATVSTPDGEQENNWRLDPAKKPKTIDMVALSGQFKGEKSYGIYKVEGNRWTVIVAASPDAKAEDRPRDFNTKDMKVRLMVWERVKDDKKR